MTAPSTLHSPAWCKLGVMHPIARLIIFVLLAALLGGCGVKTAYNNADWLVMRAVNDRVSLTGEQEQALREALDEHLQWHCSSELPAYTEFLRALEDDLSADRVTTTDLQDHGGRAAQLGERLLERIRPTLLDLLASLEDDQVEALMDSFGERNEELAEEARRSESERRKDRASAFGKGMRRFSSRPTRQQRERIEAWAADLAPTAELALQHRLQWQERFRAALSMRHDRRAFDRAMAGLLEPGSTWSEDYRQLRRKNREKTQRAMVDLHRMAPSRQSDRLRKRLSGWADDLEQLTCG